MVALRTGAPTTPLPRELTHQVQVGQVAIGGGAPVAIQSMCTTRTTDFAATLAQIRELAALGCEIVRVAVPGAEALDAFATICANSPLPVVADIHFDYQLAIAAAQRGAAALRINPGNIGPLESVDAVIDAAGEAHIPIRIGVNAGSLDRAVDARRDLTQPEKLIQSAVSFVHHFEERGFRDVVLSAKVHDVAATIHTNRELSRLVPHVPLHLGVTEAGGVRQGTVKNVSACAVLLTEGIGDTVRLSLTAPPAEEVLVAWDLLQSLGMRRRSPELVSCPTCGRCQVDLITIAGEVERRLNEVRIPITVAVMGCVVNGPGEARDADIGVACGRGSGLLFVGGKALRKVPEERIVDELFKEIHRRFG